MSTQIELYAQLSGLYGGRVYIDVAPANAVAPYAVISLVARSSVGVELDAGADYTARVQVLCRAATGAELATAQAAVDSAAQVIGGVLVFSSGIDRDEDVLISAIPCFFQFFDVENVEF